MRVIILKMFLFFLTMVGEIKLCQMVADKRLLFLRVEKDDTQCGVNCSIKLK